MKYFLFTLPLLFTGFLQRAYGQTSPAISDSTKRYLYHLVHSTEPADRSTLESKLRQLVNTNDESALIFAHDLFKELKQNSTADSVVKLLQTKYPAGLFARQTGAGRIYKSPSAEAKTQLYAIWIKQFSPARLGNDKVYDYVRYDIARSFADAGNFSRAMQYAEEVQDTIVKCESRADIATALAEKGHNGEAIALLKKNIDDMGDHLKKDLGDYDLQNARLWYAQYSNALADLFFRGQNFSEALRYARAAHDSSTLLQPEINTIYAKALSATGHDSAAFAIIDETARQGKATPEMKNMLKTLYPKVKGSNAGYDRYLYTLQSGLLAQVKEALKGKLMRKPAADFTLKDISGKTVSLKDLRGKIVILDFWATWCGPCKASFPAMKMAMERFKDRPDVKFLFIHTWENEDRPADKVRSFLAYNHYPFQVLMDLKNNTGINPVVKSYGVTGIPTKFVIDRDGNIRFTITSSLESADATVEEIAEMIAVADGKQTI